MHAIVRNLQELKLRYSVISYLSYHSFNILDDFPKSDITYFLFITVPSAVRRPPSAVRHPHPPSAIRIRRPHPHFTESQTKRSEKTALDLPEKIKQKSLIRRFQIVFLATDFFWHCGQQIIRVSLKSLYHHCWSNLFGTKSDCRLGR